MALAMMNPEPRTLAVMRFSAAGDILLAAPVVAALARAWPNSRRVFITHERYLPLVQHQPHIQHFLPLRPQESLLSLGKRMRELGIDALVDLHNSLRSRILGASLGLSPKRHVVFPKRSLYLWASQHLAHAPYRPLVPQQTRYHQLAERLVGRSLPEEPLHFHCTEEDRARAHALLQSLHLESAEPLVALLPGAAWATKRWPVAHFGALATQLMRAGAKVLVVGGPKEAALTQEIVARAPGSQEVSAALPWGTMAALLGRCHAAVAADTGPMHLARAVGTRCVILFGSTPASQFDLSGHHVIASTEHCSPCSSYGRPACPRGHLRCMGRITVDQVLEALTLTLRRGAPMTNF